MDGILELGTQKWRAARAGELSLFLSHSSIGTPGVSLSASFQFVPSWMEEEDYESEHRTLYLDVDMSRVPGLRDWRELANLELEARDAVEIGEEIIRPATSGPEIELWSHGPGGQLRHAFDGWNCRLALSALDENAYEFSAEISAFFSTKNARTAAADLHWKEMLGQEETSEDLEKEQLLEQGRSFHYAGQVRFCKVYCTVPVNTADPVRYAREMAKKQLNFTVPNRGRVNGADWATGEFKPEDGVSPTGRLVLLYPE